MPIISDNTRPSLCTNEQVRRLDLDVPSRSHCSLSLGTTEFVISDQFPDKTGKRTDVTAFLGKARAIRSISMRQPRLLFALDATASREPSWARARALHRELFTAAAEGTSVSIQLCYYRGLGEFKSSPWLTTATELLAHMDAVKCLGGATQIGRLLRHYLDAGTPATPVRGLVFVGDALEESMAELEQLAGQCRLKRQPIFLFQEGSDPLVAASFKQLARISGGAYAAFDQNSAERLRELLGAVVRYASGGRKALTSSGLEGDKILLEQLPQ